MIENHRDWGLGKAKKLSTLLNFEMIKYID